MPGTGQLRIRSARSRQPLARYVVPPFLGGREGPGAPRQGVAPEVTESLSSRALKILESLQQHGASFFDDLVHDTGLLRSDIEQGLGELVTGACDIGFVCRCSRVHYVKKRRERLRQYRRPLIDVDAAGRWSLPHVRPKRMPNRFVIRPWSTSPACCCGATVSYFESSWSMKAELPSWRELFYVYRRMEARSNTVAGALSADLQVNSSRCRRRRTCCTGSRAIPLGCGLGLGGSR